MTENKLSLRKENQKLWAVLKLLFKLQTNVSWILRNKIILIIQNKLKQEFFCQI